MLILIASNYEEMSQKAGRIVAGQIRNNPHSVLGLATGKTPNGLYGELIRKHNEEGLSFSGVTTFNLDEYAGIPRTHPRSFYQQIHNVFLNHIDINPEKIHIPDGSAKDFRKCCEEYEKAIHEAGGIDLQILGIGKTGHIGFNEPTSSLASRTRLKTLTEETIEDNRKVFAKEEVPPVAITMGIGTILEAKQILLLASGTSKTDAVAKAIEGPVTSSVTASSLQLHRNVTIVLDETAAAKLTHRKYYDRVVELTAKYSPERLGL